MEKEIINSCNLHQIAYSLPHVTPVIMTITFFECLFYLSLSFLLIYYMLYLKSEFTVAIPELKSSSIFYISILSTVAAQIFCSFCGLLYDLSIIIQKCANLGFEESTDILLNYLLYHKNRYSFSLWLLSCLNICLLIAFVVYLCSICYNNGKEFIGHNGKSKLAFTLLIYILLLPMCLISYLTTVGVILTRILIFLTFYIIGYLSPAPLNIIFGIENLP